MEMETSTESPRTNSQTETDQNGARKATSIPNLPLDVLRIKGRLEETRDHVDLLCAALVNKGLWDLLDGASLASQARELWWPWFTPRDGCFARGYFNATKWWEFLRRLERDLPSLRCCSGCLVMHPIGEFPVEQLEVPDSLRTCVFGARVGAG